jgi:hypothetical protein
LRFRKTDAERKKSAYLGRVEGGGWSLSRERRGDSQLGFQGWPIFPPTFPVSKVSTSPSNPKRFWKIPIMADPNAGMGKVITIDNFSTEMAQVDPSKPLHGLVDMGR